MNVVLALGFLLLSLLGLSVIFQDGLVHMFNSWEREEYSHGYLIPLVAVFLFAQKWNRLTNESLNGGIWGFFVVVFGVFLFFLGELSALITIVEYGFLVAFYGLVITLLGLKGARLIWASLFYLLFMIPLPNFLYNNLSSQLQLISSQLGVSFLRLVDISVYLEGNVIDLGVYKLQVVEACSGLRYLFPLTSFGFLIAYIYRGPVWQKVIIFLSTVPITVLMNSFRIGVIGVTVDNWGIEMAEGFLHDFEGWAVFIACLAVLLLEIFIFHLFSSNKQPLFDRFDLDLPEFKLPDKREFDWHQHKPFIAACLLVMLVTPIALSQDSRQELAPERKEFTNFPLLVKGWFGREGGLDTETLGTLKLTDYFIADYREPGKPHAVNLYTAYYESQRKGASIHSPASCLPGGGWRMVDLTPYEVPGIKTAAGNPLIVNRTLITLGEARQLVYYWFQGRDRIITNEYLAKWYIFWDSLTKSRTDGALVRLVTAVGPNETEADADQRFQRFLQSVAPLLPDYIPD